ncbi:MAG: transcription antitermination factor NusB [Flavobacteriaceae bacterium]|nr:transcription antitermination factor NusB [Flavobacteriaceae bacterium]
MVNRRHIRIKIMQSVYAMLQSKSDNLEKEEKFLLFSVEKVYDLFILQLLLMVEVRKMASKHLEINKKKHLATAKDKNPNLNFIQNQFILAIENSDEINKFVSLKKLDIWKGNRGYVRTIWDEIQQSEVYKDYLSNKGSSFKNDKVFMIKLFEKVIAPNEKLFDYYESLNLGWVDDLPFVNTLVLKTIKQLKAETSISFNNYEVKEDDKGFLIDLFKKAMLHQHEYNEDINEKTPNWDTDRIADIDLILIKMAMTEFLYFPSIPTKVSINEYIEISKDYSTAKSSYFINGVLDKISKDYNKSNRLNKIGRGLL